MKHSFVFSFALSLLFLSVSFPALYLCGSNVYRYVILTNLEEGDPYLEALEMLASYRNAYTIKFQNSPIEVLEELKGVFPRYVAVVIRPEDLDVNFAQEMFLVSTQMDDDPFMDFSYGFITGATPEDACYLVQNTIKAERESPSLKTVLFIAEEGPSCHGRSNSQEAEDFFEGEGYCWKYLEVPEEMEWSEWESKKRDMLPMLEGNEVIMMFGHGGPTESGAVFAVGFDCLDFRGLNLYPAVVYCGCCYGAITYRSFFGMEETCLKELLLLEANYSISLSCVESGAVAFIGGLHENGFNFVGPIFAYVYSEGESLGEGLKYMANYYIMHDGGVVEVTRLEDGERLVERGVKIEAKSTIIIGDPAYSPYEKRQPFERSGGEEGDRGEKIVASLTDHLVSYPYVFKYFEEGKFENIIYLQIKLSSGDIRRVSVECSGGPCDLPFMWTVEKGDQPILHLMIDVRKLDFPSRITVEVTYGGEQSSGGNWIQTPQPAGGDYVGGWLLALFPLIFGLGLIAVILLISNVKKRKGAS